MRMRVSTNREGWQMRGKSGPNPSGGFQPEKACSCMGFARWRL